MSGGQERVPQTWACEAAPQRPSGLPRWTPSPLRREGLVQDHGNPPCSRDPGQAETEGLVSLVFLKASAFSWGGHHWTLRGFRLTETRVKEGGRETATLTTPAPTGHPPGTVVPKPVLVKALKNWKQTHGRESVAGGARSTARFRPSCSNGGTWGPALHLREPLCLHV